MPFLFPPVSFPSLLLVPSPPPSFPPFLSSLFFSLFSFSSFALTQNPVHAGYLPHHWATSRLFYIFLNSKLENCSLTSVQGALKKENKDTQGNYRSCTLDMILGQNDTSSWSQASCERGQFPRTLWMSFLSVTRAVLSRGLSVRKQFRVPANHTFLYPLIHWMNSLEW